MIFGIIFTVRSNVEFRNLAWRRLWTDKWFGKLFGGGLLLGLCGYAVQVVLSGILGRLGVQDWQTYCQAVAMNRRDLTTPIPNLTSEFISQATSSTVLTVFFSFLMAGIASYGCAVILKKCLANDERDWLGAAFGGFKDPFGMLWLFFRYWLICFGWMLLALLPVGVIAGVCVLMVEPMLGSAPLGAAILMSVAFSLGFGIFLAFYCIPFYRYRFLWLVKAEHPDWSAGACLRSCKALMEGHKWQSFKLDCSYWKPITLVLVLFLPVVAAIGLAIVFKVNTMLVALLSLVALFAFFGALAGGVVLGQYIGVGQGFFYQDLKDGQTTNQNEMGENRFGANPKGM